MYMIHYCILGRFNNDLKLKVLFRKITFLWNFFKQYFFKDLMSFELGRCSMTTEEI